MHLSTFEKEKRFIIPLGLTALGVLSVFVWYRVAVSRLGNFSRQFEACYSQVGSLHSAIFNEDGKPKDNAAFAKVNDYSMAFDAVKASLTGIVGDVRSGRGMAFWLKAKRVNRASQLEAKIAAEEVLVTAARRALESASAVHNDAVRSVDEATKARAAAREVLKPQSEASDFQKAEGNLKDHRTDLKSVIDQVSTEYDKQVLTGLAQEIRLSVLREMKTPVKGELDRVDLKLQSIVVAQQELAKYHNRVHEIMEGNAGMLAGMEIISTKILPGVTYAYQKTDNLRSSLHSLDTPIEGAVGKVLSIFSRGDSSAGGHVSAMSLLKSADPVMGAGISSLQGLCDTVEKAYKEANGLQDTVKQVNTAMFVYRESQSRKAMGQLAVSAKTAAAYFAQKTAMFDPAIEKIEKARPYVERLRAASAKMGLPKAREFVDACANKTDSLVTAAEQPFKSGRDLIVQLRDSLRELDKREQQYIESLKALAEEPPKL